jgi:hypothetical protein
MKALQMLFWELEKVTGINPITLGSTPDPNAPVGTTEAAMQATNNALKPILNAVSEIKGSVGTCVMRRLQTGLRNSPKIRSAYEGIIAPHDMNALLMMENEGVQYGITLKPKPDAKEKARFENWINIALQNVREQRPGAELPDAIYFMSQLERGADLLDLEDQLRYIIEKSKQQAKQDAIDNMQAQAQFNAQAEQSKVQGEIAKNDSLSQGKMKEEMVRGQVKDSLLTKEFNMDFLRKLMDGADAEAGLTTKTSSK